MRRLSISTWSLHRSLGRAMHKDDSAGRLVNTSSDSARLSLLDLPAEVAAHGIGTLEICHFHLPRTDEAYLKSLRAAIDNADLELFSILIDTGDITHPDPNQREKDIQLTKRWIDVAAALGAGRTRIGAGDAEATPETIQLSAAHLRHLADFGRERGVQVITENWRRMTRRPEVVNEILDRCNGAVGLCADFGNFVGPNQLADLQAIFPRAGSIHAKASYGADGTMDRTGFRKCLELSRRAGFDGPYSLIFSDGPDEWAGLDDLRDEVLAYL